MTAPLPLHRFPAVRTTDVDEAAALFGRMTTPARFQRVARGERFEWRANALSLGAVQISAHAHGAGYEAHTEEVEDVFTTAFPLVDVPSLGFDAAGPVPVRKDVSTWIASPGRPGGFSIGTGYRALQLTFRRVDVEAALASLLGRATVPPLSLAPALSLATGVGAWLRRFVQFVVDEADQVESPFASPVVRARVAETILFAVLEKHPHDQSERLAASREAEPRYVRDAAAYLDAHAADPIQIADLARVTGVGVRALQLGFQKHRGCTPMAFLRERRLRRARETLLTDPRRTVTEVAHDAGFAHLGRFAVEYRARFGESPSETRARVRT